MTGGTLRRLILRRGVGGIGGRRRPVSARFGATEPPRYGRREQTRNTGRHILHERLENKQTVIMRVKQVNLFFPTGRSSLANTTADDS